MFVYVICYWSRVQGAWTSLTAAQKSAMTMRGDSPDNDPPVIDKYRGSTFCGYYAWSRGRWKFYPC